MPGQHAHDRLQLLGQHRQHRHIRPPIRRRGRRWRSPPPADRGPRVHRAAGGRERPHIDLPHRRPSRAPMAPEASPTTTTVPPPSATAPRLITKSSGVPLQTTKPAAPRQPHATSPAGTIPSHFPQLPHPRASFWRSVVRLMLNIRPLCCASVRSVIFGSVEIRRAVWRGKYVRTCTSQSRKGWRGKPAPCGTDTGRGHGRRAPHRTTDGARAAGLSHGRRRPDQLGHRRPAADLPPNGRDTHPNGPAEDGRHPPVRTDLDLSARAVRATAAARKDVAQGDATDASVVGPAATTGGPRRQRRRLPASSPGWSASSTAGNWCSTSCASARC